MIGSIRSVYNKIAQRIRRLRDGFFETREGIHLSFVVYGMGLFWENFASMGIRRKENVILYRKIEALIGEGLIF